jgi:hypothetical protein
MPSIPRPAARQAQSPPPKAWSHSLGCAWHFGKGTSACMRERGRQKNRREMIALKREKCWICSFHVAIRTVKAGLQVCAAGVEPTYLQFNSFCRLAVRPASELMFIGTTPIVPPTAPGAPPHVQCARTSRRCDNPPKKIPYYRLKPIHFGH